MGKYEQVAFEVPGHSTERAVTQVATILERLGCSAVVFRVEDGRDREELARELAEVVGRLT